MSCSTSYGILHRIDVNPDCTLGRSPLHTCARRLSESSPKVGVAECNAQLRRQIRRFAHAEQQSILPVADELFRCRDVAGHDTSLACHGFKQGP